MNERFDDVVARMNVQNLNATVEYPKMLYHPDKSQGTDGWLTVKDEIEEAAAREQGFLTTPQEALDTAEAMGLDDDEEDSTGVRSATMDEATSQTGHKRKGRARKVSEAPDANEEEV